MERPDNISVGQGKGRKILSIQDLRGVAVLLVVLVHSINVVDYRVSRHVDSALGHIATFLSLNEFGAAGVDLFFVISGFVMALLIERGDFAGRGDFLWRRFLRIVPLFWLATWAYTLLCVLVGRRYIAPTLWANWTIIPFNPSWVDLPVLVIGWSLAFELVFYLLVALVLARKRPRLALCGLLLALVWCASCVRIPAGTLAVLANPIQLEFLWGIVVYTLCAGRPACRATRIIGTCLIAVGCYVLARQILYGLPFNADFGLIFTGATSFARAMRWGLPWACVVAGYVLIEQHLPDRPGPVRQMLRKTGESSYALYLVHLPICMLAETLLHGDALPPDMLIVAVCLLSWIAGMATHKWIERPLLRALGKVRFPAGSRRVAPVLQPEPSASAR